MLRPFAFTVPFSFAPVPVIRVAALLVAVGGTPETVNELLAPVWPAPSLAVSTTFVSVLFTVTLPVQMPPENAVVVVGETESAPPVPLAERPGVPV